ncbi:MAG: tyrosine-type recombinase/integrase [Bacteroidales bacterium]|jgi:integrase/recombinase XerD|nr:tyrosine-type recombinase/integrase [Bacteroidales bacterium]
MRTKTSFTIVERAQHEVPGFSNVLKTLERQVVLKGQSSSTLSNYIRRIALISLHFKRLPEDISDDEIQEYLIALALDAKSPSRSSFKHAVYGLRYYFRHVGNNKRAINLPAIKNDLKLPVILNRSELKELFKAPTLLKHRIILSLIYSAGLRGKEVINLKLSDIDFERKTIHIRQSKYNKDRMVPLANYMAQGLQKYIDLEHPYVWVFNGNVPQSQYSKNGLSWVMRTALKNTTITKEVSLHSLRHSYATHLLEDGVNIVKIKELLGHVAITTTMIYLHVAQCSNQAVHSPLDTLYETTKI